MILTLGIGAREFLEDFATLTFLREGNLPDVEGMTRAIKDAAEPLASLAALQKAAWLRSLGELSGLAFPLYAGRFVLSVLLAIASAMAMSGRPGSRSLALQALVANAAFAVLTYWLLRDARYAWADTIAGVRDVLPALPDAAPPDQREAWPHLLDREIWLWLPRAWLVLFDVCAPMLAAITLLSPRTKDFFDAVAAAQEQAEDP